MLNFFPALTIKNELFHFPLTAVCVCGFVHVCMQKLASYCHFITNNNNSQPQLNIYVAEFLSFGFSGFLYGDAILFSDPFASER